MFDTLRAMLTYCRPHGTYQDRDFCTRFLAPLPGAYQDEYGNWHVKVSDDPILWSSHTDTVHRLSVRQRVVQEGDWFCLPADSKSDCLGADDTAGVWLMTELIAAKVPGHYVFHYGEERGCMGSGKLARHHADWLKTFKMAIALDRRGEGDVITHQFGGRCCSDAFAFALAEKLGPAWQPTSGVYTDTAEYIDLIPECTNLSVGYLFEHSDRERLNTAHLARLLSSLLSLDYNTLPIARDPNAWEDDDWNYGYSYHRGTYTARDPVVNTTVRAIDWDPIVRCPDCHMRDVLSDTDGFCQYCGGELEDDDDDWDRHPFGDVPPVYLSTEYSEVARHFEREDLIAYKRRYRK